jgi:ribosome modulation factor
MITKATLKGRRKAREAAGVSYVAILKAGERAGREGLGIERNPYPKGEDHDTWLEGYWDGRKEAAS